MIFTCGTTAATALAKMLNEPKPGPSSTAQRTPTTTPIGASKSASAIAAPQMEAKNGNGKETPKRKKRRGGGVAFVAFHEDEEDSPRSNFLLSPLRPFVSRRNAPRTTTPSAAAAPSASDARDESFCFAANTPVGTSFFASSPSVSSSSATLVGSTYPSHTSTPIPIPIIQTSPSSNSTAAEGNANAVGGDAFFRLASSSGAASSAFGGGCFSASSLRPPLHKTLSVNESFSLPSLTASPAAFAQRRGAAREAFSGTLKEMGDFELLEVLGEGFFGVVYKVREKARPSAEPIVMKIPIMRDQPNLPPQSAKKIANKEDYMLTALAAHPNILKSKGLCVQRSPLHWQLNLLVEFCDGGSLQQTILGPNPMPWAHIGHICADICSAMEYVHRSGFMHRDLTSMNVLLKSNNNQQRSLDPDEGLRLPPTAVVADFGLSTKIPEHPHVLQQVGTQNWMAPEVLKELFYNEKVDVFSFGIILCQMIARIDADHDAGLYRTSSFGIDFAKFAEQKCPSDAPVELMKLAYECCLLDASARPSFSQLLRQFSPSFIAKLRHKSIEGNGGQNNNNSSSISSSPFGHSFPFSSSSSSSSPTSPHPPHQQQKQQQPFVPSPLPFSPS